MKIHLVVVELFHAYRKKDGRADIKDDANSRFSQFFEQA